MQPLSPILFFKDVTTGAPRPTLLEDEHLWRLLAWRWAADPGSGSGSATSREQG